MRLVERHVISKNSPMFEEVDELAFLSKNLYNRGNYEMRQHFFKTGKILSYEKMDILMQNQDAYHTLPSKVSQQILMLLNKNWKAWQEADKKYQKNPASFLGKPRIPKYKDKLKGRNILVYTTVHALSKPGLRSLIIPSTTNLSIPTRQQQICQVRILPKLDHYLVEVIHEREPIQHDVRGERIASIDLGLDNLAAITSKHKEFKPILVSGRHIKSVNQYYNKRKARLQSKLKGNQKTSQRIQRLSSKRNRKVDHYLHCASRLIINTLVAHGIGTLVIGKNDGWKQQTRHGRQNNQNFVGVPHSRFVEMLKYKAALVGIKVVLTEESYTSLASFLDFDEIPTYGQVNAEPKFSGRRVKRGLYKSKNGILINSDINGSANVMRKVFPIAFAEGIEAVVVQPVRVLAK